MTATHFPPYIVWVIFVFLLLFLANYYLLELCHVFINNNILQVIFVHLCHPIEFRYTRDALYQIPGCRSTLANAGLLDIAAVCINSNHFACQLMGMHRHLFDVRLLLFGLRFFGTDICWVERAGHFFVILSKFNVQTFISPLSL